MQVKDIMRVNPVTIHGKATIKEAIDLIAKNKVSALVVVNERDYFEGIVSRSDIIRRQSQPGKLSNWLRMETFLHRADEGALSEEEHEDDLSDFMDSAVEDIFTGRAVSVKPDDDITRVMKLMKEYGINHIPVVVNKKAIGIIARDDIINALSKMYTRQ
jgi:CBS domain-containing protein